jgi:hypothetical protein
MASKSEDSQTTDALAALYRAAMALNRTGTRSIPDMSEVALIALAVGMDRFRLRS